MAVVETSRSRGGNGPLARAFRRFAANGAALAGLAILVPMLVLIVCYPLILGHKPNDIDLLALNKGPERGALARHRRRRPRHPGPRAAGRAHLAAGRRRLGRRSRW